MQLDEMKQEKLFAKYDKDGSGQIDYEEFKMIWLEVANLRKELSDREVKYPKFATKGQLMRIMKKVLDEEEEAERHALAEADQHKRWQKILKEKRKLTNAARRRALLELRTCTLKKKRKRVIAREKTRSLCFSIKKHGHILITTFAPFATERTNPPVNERESQA